MNEDEGALDTFVVERLPPASAWPELLFELPELHYPARLNCAVALLDDRIRAGFGDRPCFIGASQTWTYREVATRVERIGNVLRRHGVRRGARVLLRGPNNPMMLAGWLATLRIGAVAVATMPLLRARELAVVIEKAAIAFALCDGRLADELAEAARASPSLRTTLTYAPDESGSLDNEMREVPAECEAADTVQDDVALVAFTSGTTGVPKGCIHFHRDVLAAADTFSRYVLEPRPDDVFCAGPPIAFTFGLGGALVFPLRVGAATVLTEVSSPKMLLEAIERHRVTVCFTAPTAYRAMLESNPAPLKTLRRCVSAGEALSAETRRAFKATTGIELIDGIGSTEMMHIFISAADEAARAGATGKPVPGFRAAILDAAGNELPRGSTGRLAVKGPTGCRYLADTRQADYVQGGWNVTGDTYFVDDDGYYWFRGRSDDMIVSAGYNISGLEVEAVLLEHPDVRECAVVAWPDDERGHIVKAFVVSRNGVADDASAARRLQEFVKSRIAPYKYPRAVTFVASLPRTETGKLQRYRLRYNADARESIFHRGEEPTQG